MIKGEVILLRALEEGDLPLITQWNFDDTLTLYFSSRLPNGISEQKKWFDTQVGRSDKKKLIILDKSNTHPIGLLGLMNIDHLNKNCEVGITIGDVSYWGKSHARDAMDTILNFLFKEYNMHMVYLTVFADNSRAVSFFKKLGFKENGTMRQMIFRSGIYHDLLWMSILKEEHIH